MLLVRTLYQVEMFVHVARYDHVFPVQIALFLHYTLFISYQCYSTCHLSL